MSAARKNITATHYELLASLRYGLRRFMSFSQDAARAAGLTPQQHQALLAVKGFACEEGVSVGLLAERLLLKHHSAVGLVDRLVDRGLLRRIRSKSDRRRIDLQLTARGETIIERLSEVHLKELRQLGPDLHRLIGSIIDA